MVLHQAVLSTVSCQFRQAAGAAVVNLQRSPQAQGVHVTRLCWVRGPQDHVQWTFMTRVLLEGRQGKVLT
jgi:hypothetical protein